MIEKIELMAVRCGYCNVWFKHVETGNGLMKCSECGREYIRKNGGWYDKIVHDALESEAKNKETQ